MISSRPVDGILLVDKARGPTSHDVVDEVRRALKAERAGHAGTLDPMASGLLVILLGRATRLALYLEAHDKEYVFTVRLGLATDTDDAAGRTIEERDASGVNREAVESASARFRGRIRQRPPAYSAVKVEGERAYRKARRGEAVEIPEREVEVHELELVSFDPPEATLRLRCSKGTYVRSIARDLGAALGCGGCVTSLRRTASGPHRVEQAIELAGTSDERLSAAVRPMEDALVHLPAVDLGEGEARKFLHGSELDLEPPAALVRVRHEGRLLGVGEARGARIKPRTVIGEGA